MDDIQEGTQKEIIWAGAKGAKNPCFDRLCPCFSATKEEIRPVPDNVAANLGANLYFTRLTGHGRGPEGMIQTSVNDWLNDVAEATAIGRRLGERVVIIATSQGGTMTAMSTLDQTVMENVAGIAFVSPNFGLVARSAGLLTIPFASTIVPMIAGETRSWDAANAEHAKWWNTSYPTNALLPLATAVKGAAYLPYHTIMIPAFFAYSPKDTVVKPSEIERIAGTWGGPTEIWPVELGPGDDAAFHVIAGDILSPSITQPMSARLTDWIKALPGS